MPKTTRLLALFATAAIALQSSASAAVLYSRTTETGTRFNPASATTGPFANNLNTLTYDDVPIPVARLAGATMIDITRITVGIRQAAGEPATTLDIYAFDLTNGGDPTPYPQTSLGTATITANTGAGFRTVLATVGDGVTPLTRISVNAAFITGGAFGTIGVGGVLKTASGNTGFRLTSGPDANIDQFGLVRVDQNPLDPTIDGYGYGLGSADVDGFYIIVEGNPVPEPVSLAALALGGMVFARRRRA